ncbi:MAG: hypothetical protein Q4F18_11775 [Clostridia bacterium]|nr:hypothetical protein [Clostridia bacterium]
MTGMDVLRRCAAYERDVRRMKAMLHGIRDVMTRVTRPTDAQGRGGAGDRLGNLTARADEIERGICARKAAYNMEVMEALRLVGEMDNPGISTVMYSKYVEGCTYAAIAMRQKTSESAVRSAHRRGCEALKAVRSGLTDSAAYAAARKGEDVALCFGKNLP